MDKREGAEVHCDEQGLSSVTIGMDKREDAEVETSLFEL